MRYATTRTRIGNTPVYPCLTIKWEESGMGWIGKCSIWKDGNTKVDCKEEHIVEISQSMPLGIITVMFDGFAGGCWKYQTFAGHGITERDLEWAAAWSLLALEAKHKLMPECYDESNLAASKANNIV